MRLTEHFTDYEFRCRCGCGAEKAHLSTIERTAVKLETLRTALNADPELINYRTSFDGSPREISIIIESAVRCPARNKAVQGKPKSRHLSTAYAGAVDYYSPQVPLEYVWDKAKSLFPCAIMYTKRGIVHCDSRMDGTYYAVDGTPMPGKA